MASVLLLHTKQMRRRWKLTFIFISFIIHKIKNMYQTNFLLYILKYKKIQISPCLSSWYESVCGGSISKAKFIFNLGTAWWRVVGCVLCSHLPMRKEDSQCPSGIQTLAFQTAVSDSDDSCCRFHFIHYYWNWYLISYTYFSYSIL
jgi:hypothetical protein